MKAVINGTLYNTSKTETLCEVDHHNNGNYAGTTYLERASDGTLLVWCCSNGQDLHYTDALYAAEEPQLSDIISAADLDDNQIKRLAELGLIKIA